MKQYNIREFRAGLREAFNEAESGETVIITRHDVDFILKRKAPDSYTEVGFIKKTDLEKVNIPGETVTLHSTPPVKNNSEGKPSKIYCGAGHLLASGSNRCLQKGCKYA